MKNKVRILLRKSRESSILAVNVYNNPTSVFRSSGYIVLMNIAWLSLFQGIFERDRIKYYYRDNKDKRKYIRIDGQPKTWELLKCAKEYFKGMNDPIYQNIQFFIGFRNKIEHSYAPELDTDIFGECQSYLMNFEEILVKEFGNKYSLADSLHFALQYSRFRTDEQLEVIKKIQSKSFLKLKEYVDDFRKNLDPTILSNPKFSFKVFLIQKPANRMSSADAAIEFVKFDPKKPDEMEKYERIVTLLKEKEKIIESPQNIRLVRNKKENAENYLLVDREASGNLPTVGITKDPKKSSGILVIETLSDEIFEDVGRIVDAGKILNERFKEFPFKGKTLFFIYGGREQIKSDESSKLLLNASYSEYIPYYYWLLNLSRDDIINFFKEKIKYHKHPCINSIIRLICSTNKKSYINYFEEFCKPIKHHSQKPNWYWAFRRWKEEKDEKARIYSILRLKPHNEIFGIKVEELLKNNEASVELLSNICIEYASGNNVDKGSLRHLDLITYYKKLSDVLPEINS